MIDKNEYRPFDVEAYLHLVQSFHGHVAPGAVIGGFMVHLAKGSIPEGVLFKAICETSTCLPDAIQLLTPCTIGNGRLDIVNLGRFALSLYDKDLGNGFRVFLDSKKIDKWPEIKTWFFKLIPKSEQKKDLLLAQIKESGQNLCEIQPIQVQSKFLQKQKRGEIVICPCCHEPYPAKDGDVCRGCQWQSPYVIPETSKGCISTFNTLKSHGVY